MAEASNGALGVLPDTASADSVVFDTVQADAAFDNAAQLYCEIQWRRVKSCRLPSTVKIATMTIRNLEGVGIATADCALGAIG